MKVDKGESKLSDQFEGRLANLAPSAEVRAVVLLHSKSTLKAHGKRQSQAARQATVESRRKSAEQALPEIDHILVRVGGKRLAKSPDALGSILVQTTAKGIKALAASHHVKAILEDQKISLIK